jgi:hypothetical protein
MSLAGRMSGRASSSSRPYAWIVGVLLVLVALVGLQFDRLSTAKISTVAAIEYSILDAADDSDDDTFRIGGGKAVASAPCDALALYTKSWSSLPGSNKAARPDAPYSRHARGPPLSV